MKLIFVRHGEPDYVNDTLTERGWREARLLADRICKWKVTDFYCSPLGRARDTASCTLEKMSRTAKTLDWIREFSYPIVDPVTGRRGVPWDFIPSYWSNDPLMLDIDRWVDAEIPKQNPQIALQYPKVCSSMDELLASYGYIREGRFYRRPDSKGHFMASTPDPGDAEEAAIPSDPDEPCLVLFCHLGVICIILSHLLNIPFPLLVHGIFLPPASITILSSEERWDTEAYFRAQAIGDVHHLLSGGEPLSAAGSFAAVFQG